MTYISVKTPDEQHTNTGRVTKQPEKKLNLFPVSFSQQQMWVLDQLSPGTSTYTISEALRLQGRLNLEALQAALQELTNRHEVLRTIFPSASGRPLQLVQAPTALNLPLEDISAWPAEVRESHLMQRLQAETTRPFHLASGPLFRTKLFRVQEQDHVLLISVHHIIFDGWSLGILINDLTQLYDAFVAGRPSPLAPLPVQYADFARWQRAWMQSPAYEEQLAFWKARLHEPLPVLDLPTDRPRPLVQSFVGTQYSFGLPRSLAQALRQLSQRAGTTMFTTLLAAWQVLLSRYSGQKTDICIGIPVANRTRPEIEELIGCFINTLTVRSDLSGDPSFLQVLRHVSQRLLDAYAHQDLPFDKLAEEVHPKRSMNIHPLFQSMFVWQNGPQPLLHMSELEIHSLPLPNATAKLDLTCFLWETGEELEGSIEYNTDLFAETTIRCLFDHYQTLLENMVADPNCKLSQLSLISARERQHMLVDWNATATPYPETVLLHQLIEAQVERTPTAIAVRFQDTQLTYRELNARANQLAHHLRARGVQTDQLVGICMQRSLELVIGLVGILKAGAAYVPLDPEYPQERLAFLLQDAQVALLLTQAHLQARLPEQRARVLCLDSDWSSLAEMSTQNPASEEALSPDTLAYMIYTSGSTGQPKGAMNTHRAICNRLLWMQQTYQLQASDHVLQKTPFSFDVSVWEFFWPLLCGARLVLARPGGHRESSYLLDVIAQEHISTLHFVPSMLSAFLEHPDVERCQGVKRVICSGEALSSELQERFFARFGSLGSERPELHNLYGPTEAAVDVTSWACQPDEKGTSVPIGRPIANIQIYLLDGRLQPVPIGIAGDLYIGGIGLARGYYQRPGLTAERFLPHPWAQRPGERLYQTGDVARYRPDGAIEYLGRIDHQIKLRGFRIELGEIEAALHAHPKVGEAVVMAREDIPGDMRLVAYLVPQDEEGPTGGELRAFLSARLPSHMLPVAYVQLSVLPLTANGKLDRKVLPPPGGERPDMEAAYTAPRTPDEEAIARSWAMVLGLDRVGIRDNFFDLGGHSFSAVRLMYEIEKATGRHIPAGTIFQAPTVEQLAPFVAEAGSVNASAASASTLVALRSAGSGHPLLFIHPIGGNVLCYSNLIGHLNTDRPVYGLAAAGLRAQTPPDSSITSMAQRYVQTLIASGQQEPYLLLGWSMGGIIALEMAQVLRRQWNKVAHVLLLDSHIEALGEDGEWDDAALVAGFAEDWGQSTSYDLDVREEVLRKLTPNQMTAYLLTKAAEVGVVAPGTDIAYIQLLLEVFKANAFALRDYRLTAQHIGKLALFRATHTSLSLTDPTGGWGAWAEGIVEVAEIPTDHYGMMKEPHVTQLAHAIERRLETWGF